MSLADCCCTARWLVGTVHVGFVQGLVTHAVHWFRSVSATKYDRCVADDDQYVDRCHLLRALCRPLDHTDPVLRHVQTPLSWKGNFHIQRLFMYRILRSGDSALYSYLHGMNEDLITDAIWCNGCTSPISLHMQCVHSVICSYKRQQVSSNYLQWVVSSNTYFSYRKRTCL